MILVDDRLALDVLAGRPVGEHDARADAAITWGFHYRLVRALMDDRVTGLLTSIAASDVRARAARPPADRLVVVDPRGLTATAAAVAVRHGLNLLAAELTAAAIVHSATVVLSAPNVGRRWQRVFDAEGVVLETVDV